MAAMPDFNLVISLISELETGVCCANVVCHVIKVIAPYNPSRPSACRLKVGDVSGSINLYIMDKRAESFNVGHILRIQSGHVLPRGGQKAIFAGKRSDLQKLCRNVDMVYRLNDNEESAGSVVEVFTPFTFGDDKMVMIRDDEAKREEGEPDVAGGPARSVVCEENDLESKPRVSTSDNNTANGDKDVASVPKSEEINVSSNVPNNA
ncbi:hypothetical protein ACJJTC_017845 [Scirpophaga incertulas]